MPPDPNDTTDKDRTEETPEEMIDRLFATPDIEGISSSEAVYLEFRRTVEPGMIDAEFDLIPAKSTAYGYTDQTLRSHILNGATFAAQLNAALKTLDPSSALSDTGLREAMALFSVHDLHKTPEAQQRRLENPDRNNADKDVTEEEVKKYVELLRLRDLETNFREDDGDNIADFQAAATRPEQTGGPHRGSESRTFTLHRDWVRLMDSIAAKSTPRETTDLANRLHNISEKVDLATHELPVTKGVTTNILQSTVATAIDEQTDAIPLVYFPTGVAYLVPAGFDFYDKVTEALSEEARSDSGDPGLADEEETISTVLAAQYLETVREVGPFDDDTQLTDAINADWQKSQVGIPRGVYLLKGYRDAFNVVQERILARPSDSWSKIAAYEHAVTASVGSDTLDRIRYSHEQTIPTGLYISSFFREMFKELASDTNTAITQLGEALKIPQFIELIEECEGTQQTYSREGCPESVASVIAEHLDGDVDEYIDELEAGVSLSAGGVLRFPFAAALFYLEKDAPSGGTYGEQPISVVLEAITDDIFTYYDEWGGDWTVDRQTASATPVETLQQSFEAGKVGQIEPTTAHVLSRNLLLDGQRPGGYETSKSKFGEYTRASQPRLCLTCGEVLVGSNSMKDFESGKGTMGISLEFTHLKHITPVNGKGKPTSTVCPLCELEMILRRTVYGGGGDEKQHFMFSAPDYFYSPVDIEIQRQLHQQLYVDNGAILRLTEQILTQDPSNRAELFESVWTILGQGVDNDEREGWMNKVWSYDAMFDDCGPLGVYQIDAPRKENKPEQVTRIPQWLMSTAFGTLFSWLTSSRVLVSESPIPRTSFEEFDEFIRFEQQPDKTAQFTGETATLSNLHDLDAPVEEFSFPPLPIWQTIEPDGGEQVDLTAFTESGNQETDAESPTDADGATEPEVGHNSSNSQQTTERSKGPVRRPRPVSEPITIRTEFGVLLYKLAAFHTVSREEHGWNIQRLAQMLDAATGPFPGARSLLKGTTSGNGSVYKLPAATILDTLLNPTMANRIDKLSELGFDLLHPESGATNHSYERLFRVACDTLEGDITENTSKEELITLVTGEVMKSAARNTENPDYADERYKQQTAAEFAEVFINDIYTDICDADYFTLRDTENRLASGYNAGVRRHQQNWFDEYNEQQNAGSNENSGDDDSKDPEGIEQDVSPGESE